MSPPNTGRRPLHALEQIEPGSRPPSVDALARKLAPLGLPHPLCVRVAREAIAAGDPGSAEELGLRVRRSLLGAVVNATGVLLHTNLGRAPLGVEHRARPVNLEIDLERGGRGRRAGTTSVLVTELTGAEAALVVNNGAAALLLVLAAIAPGATVVISRGELVEIGGGFRIPEVLAGSGARLVEVGTTNRTRLGDYRAGLQHLGEVSPTAAADNPYPAIVLKVHRSNYRMVGFTEEVPVSALATLGVPVIHDIGSGLLDAATPWLPGGPPPWLAEEPAARQSLRAGAWAVTFSGDKLLGGPQAGIIAGRAELVNACAQHPMARALRPGGLILAALERTLLAYLAHDWQAIPFWQMATVAAETLRSRAERLGVGKVVPCASAIGGGALPGITLPSAGVAIPGDHTAMLRHYQPPIVALARDNHTVCDLRTVDPADDVVVASALRAAT